MTPTVANLNPAISLFLTRVSTPTHRRTSTCAHIATAVGMTTSKMMRNHSGRLDRKYDTLVSEIVQGQGSIDIVNSP